MPEHAIHAGDHVGEYLLLERIFHDPLCEAWKARSEKGNRLVTLRLPCDPRVAECFAALKIKVRPPGSRQLLWTLRRLEIDGRPVIVQEYAEGRELLELISRQGRLPPGRARYLFIQILRGLAELHGEGLPHGNLKPGSVIVSRRDAVRLADVDTGLICGRIATERLRDAGRNGSHGNGLLAFVTYQPPEQHRGADAGMAGDVYAAGLLLHEMLTGHPHAGELTVADIAALPDWAVEVLPTCLERIEFRYPTAMDVLEALGVPPRRTDRQHQAKADVPIAMPVAIPIKQRGKLRNTQRRSVRKMVAWITITTALLVPASFFVIWLWLWQSDKPVAGLHAEAGPASATAGRAAPSKWTKIGSDYMWRWTDSLRGVDGRDVLPSRDKRFMLVRLRVPDEGPGGGLMLRGDGSQASVTDGEGTLYPCRGYVFANRYRPRRSSPSPAVRIEANGWVILVFELPSHASRLRLRVQGFGGTWDTPLG